MEGKDDKTISPLFHTDVKSMFQETISCVGCGKECVIMLGGPKCCSKRTCLEEYFRIQDIQFAKNIAASDLRKANLKLKTS